MGKPTVQDRAMARAREMARIAADIAFSIGQMIEREDIKVRADAIYGELVDLEAALGPKYAGDLK